MKIFTKSIVGLAIAAPVLVLAFGGALGSAALAKSGLRPGESVTAFTPTHVTGADAGTKTCPVCKYGKTPAVQVWVNGDSMENVAKIADVLEASIKMEGTDKLKAFVIYIKPVSMSEGDMTSQLKMVADKCHLSNLALAYVDGPKAEPVGQYKINTSDAVKNTILVYHDMKVSNNFVNFKANDKGVKSLKGALMKACGM